jgi:hypothetical protein
MSLEHVLGVCRVFYFIHLAHFPAHLLCNHQVLHVVLDCLRIVSLRIKLANHTRAEETKMALTHTHATHPHLTHS